MLLPEQKSANLLQDILCKVTKYGDLVLDACCGTIFTGRACFLLQRNRGFKGCERDPNCEAEAIPSLAKTFCLAASEQGLRIDGIRRCFESCQGPGRRSRWN